MVMDALVIYSVCIEGTLKQVLFPRENTQDLSSVHACVCVCVYCLSVFSTQIFVTQTSTVKFLSVNFTGRMKLCLSSHNSQMAVGLVG